MRKGPSGETLFVAGVTGTNGKTSVVEFARQILDACGHTAASLGSLGFVSTLTGREPDPVIGAGEQALPAFFDRAASIGVDALVYEAFAPSLGIGMHDTTALDAAAFTTFAPEHLSYHGSAEAYLAAKLRLFSRALADDGVAVINGEAQQSAAVMQVCDERGVRRVLVGRDPGADIAVLGETRRDGGTALTLDLLGTRYRALLPLLAPYEIDNATLALGLAAFGASCPLDDAVAALGELRRPPGRMVRVGERRGGVVVVDYAHNPLGLDACLAALRSETPGELILVFGAGGDPMPERRVEGKRREMGRVAATHADVAIVTDDNPRSEDPAAIRAEVLDGAPSALEIPDRAEAIRAAVDRLGPGDTLLIAGKGDEEAIVRDGETEAHSDIEVARQLLDTD